MQIHSQLHEVHISIYYSLHLHNGTNNKAEVKNILLDSICIVDEISDKFYSNKGPKIREVKYFSTVFNEEQQLQ